ncbi:MAG TPA: GNAT family N-acetyltransferase [Acholeplasmataceae bacterium]|nr:GNAT family N-acetyltransferase [Acholeplasmataceae bacterium]
MESYQHANGFEMIPAEQKEFARYFVIYRLQTCNMWFPVSMEKAEVFYSAFLYPYWIYQNGERVGGAVFEPNRFGLVFPISPFSDECALVKGAFAAVLAISDRNKPITAFSVPDPSLPYYYRLGFQVEETEKQMICVTKPYEVVFPDNVRADVPRAENLKQMIDLYYEVYSHSNVQSIAKTPYSYYEETLTAKFSDLVLPCSTLLYSGDELVASCAVTIWQDLPFIMDIVVKKPYRELGLGGKMIKKVLNASYGKYPAVRLAVVPGNHAEALYLRLGFVGGVATSEMILKPEE